MEAQVLFDYVAQDSDELTIKKGEIIQNVTQSMDGWYEGTLEGEIGIFPDNFVQILEVSDIGEDVPEDVEEEDEKVWWNGKLQGKVGIFSANGNAEARIFEGHHVDPRPVAVVKPNSPAIAGGPTGGGIPRRATCEGAFYQTGNREQASRLDTVQLQAVQARLQDGGIFTNNYQQDKLLPELRNSVSDLINARKSSLPEHRESTKVNKASHDIIGQVRQVQLKKKEDLRAATSSSSSFNLELKSKKPPPNPKPKLTPGHSSEEQIDGAQLRKNENSFVTRSASISGKTTMLNMIENVMKGHQTTINPLPNSSAKARNFTSYLPGRRDFISYSESKTPERSNLEPMKEMRSPSSYFEGVADSTFSSASSSRPTNSPPPPPLSTKPNFTPSSPSFPLPPPPPPLSTKPSLSPSSSPFLDEESPDRKALLDSIRAFSKDKLKRVSSEEKRSKTELIQPISTNDFLNSILTSKLFQRQKACIGNSLDEADEDEWSA